MTKLTDVVESKIIERLKEQTEHLGNLAKGEGRKDDLIMWNHMLNGAKTVIDILDFDLGRSDTYSKIVHEMSLDRLKSYRNFIDGRINEIQADPKVTIYGVFDDCVYNGWFKTYEEASTRLKQVINDSMALREQLECKFGITEKEVFESQAAEYLEV